MASKEIDQNSIIELQKNTEVIEDTFESVGLQVNQFLWQSRGEGGQLNCILEFSGKVDLPSDIIVSIKIDLIDDLKLEELKNLFPDEDKVFISVKSNI